MPALTDLEKVRRRRARRRTIRNLFLLTLFAGFVILCVSAIKYVGELDLATAYSDIKAGVVTGDGFPVTLPGGQIGRMEGTQDVMMLLSDTNLYSYSTTGRQLLGTQHNMLNPAMSAAGDRVLLYDRGGTKYSLFSKSALISQSENPYTIHTGDLAANGNYALASGSDKTLAKVAVYNRSGDNIFNWFSTKPVVSVSLSDNRDFMLVGHVDVANGSYQSNISKFQFSINEGAIATAELDAGELLLWADYRSANEVRVLTDRRAILMNGDLRELKSFPFGSEKLDRVIDRNGSRILLVLGSFVEDKQMRVISLNEEFATLADFTINYDLISIRADGEYLYLVSRDGIEIRSQGGKLLSTLPMSGVHQIEPMQGVLYYTTATEIRTLNVAEQLAPKGEKKEDKKDSKEEKKPDKKADASSKGESSSENSSEPESSSAPASSAPEESSILATSEPVSSSAAEPSSQN